MFLPFDLSYRTTEYISLNRFINLSNSTIWKMPSSLRKKQTDKN